jgi:DNA transformation protein
VAVSADYLNYVLDQLAPFARVTSRRMFGGVGLYANELFFALIDDDTLYFKVDETNRADYLARGSVAFMPIPGDPSTQMSGYFQVPADVLEDSDELTVWARKSLSVAAAAAAKKLIKRKRTRSRR